MPDITNVIVNWMDKKNHLSKEEFIITHYGLQLIIDSALKLLSIQILGFMFGKGLETFLSLLTFCTLRSQAGGIHAKTNAGCTLSMVGVCVLSILCNHLKPVSIPIILSITVAICGTVLLFAPYTINKEYFSSNVVFRKKIVALIILMVWFMIGIILIRYRNVIMCALALEGITLIPISKIANPKEVINHEMDIY